jgi:hypothetical protein
MRIIASMKMINCNGWAPRSSKPVPYEWSAPIPITNPLIANHNNLYNNFHTYKAGGVAYVYYNLSLFI